MRILEIQLESNDLPATKRFYMETLGMELISESRGRLEIKAGHSVLTFIANQHANPFYHFAFTIPAHQFTEAHDWVSRRLNLMPVKDGSTIAEFINWNARSFYCYDNNGNILEYIARFDLPSFAEKTFSGPCIVSISEIGIVPGFAVMGNDEGLVIVVDEDRPWYPTLKKAGCFNTYVKAEDRGRLFELSVREKVNGAE
ncbi:MAG: hypothetical protein EOO00_12895 [Chitinophagaceae bacterium]|nr:MAG: hypothetical protein EOO00_12895 [Chitinophagaceae bacterium]